MTPYLILKEVERECGIASRTKPTYLPFLSLIKWINFTYIPQRYINFIRCANNQT